MTPPRPFCELSASHVSNAGELGHLVMAIRDRYPVSPGHTLVVPRRHVATYFEASEVERSAIWRRVEEVKRALDAELDPRPDGYNVGFNAPRFALGLQRIPCLDPHSLHRP